MLVPKRVKHRKQMRGRRKGMAHRGSTVSFGEFGLQALEPAWITNRQIEAARVAITRYIKRGGKMWIRIFPDKPVTVKPAETRMGKGKGSPEFWVAVVKPGRVLFELRKVVRMAKKAVPGVRAPTLIIQSREDPRIAPDVAESALGRIGAREKQLVWTEGAGHIITVDYGRERVFSEVEKWLRSHAGRNATAAAK